VDGAYARRGGLRSHGGAGGARYNPRTGTYSRGAVAYGPYGSRGAASAYNPRTGTAATTRQGSNVYGSWGTTGVARGDDWAKTSRYTSNVTGNTTRVTRTSEGDVYAGRNGEVYRKDGDNYQKYSGSGEWSNVDRSNAGDASTRDQVTRDSAARAEGAQRTRDSGNVRSGSSGRTSSYRASGGGRAGGGGGGRRR
jgi:hypothetical protein